MTEPAIELEDVVVQFANVRAVDGISLRVEEGELLTVIGASGSGKTTALKTVNRLVELSSGAVRLHGRDLRALVPHELRRRVGYCFQGVGLFPHFTVAQNIGVTPALLGWPAARVAARVDELLERVDLDPAAYRDRMPSALSGGQRQRVGVARALAAEPEVVLFDEPFGALDPITRELLQDEIRALREALPFTGIFVTHDVVEALSLGDRVAVMRDGRLLQVGTQDELARDPVDEYVARLMETPRRMLTRAARRA